MACGCKPVGGLHYLWIPPGQSAESDETMLYDSEIQAKAKVIRKGGSYIEMVKTPTGQYRVKV
jgi:hypothetical protein